jgi:hypothetical protein
VQTVPLPVKNGSLQAQLHPPGVLVQVPPMGSQSLRPRAHSSISAQVTPSPSYPGWHAHVKLPFVLVHTALTWQLCVFKVHSSMSAVEGEQGC